MRTSNDECHTTSAILSWKAEAQEWRQGRTDGDDGGSVGAMSWFSNLQRAIFPRGTDATWGAEPAAAVATVVILFGLIGTVAYSGQYAPLTTAIAVTGLAGLLGLAALLLGGLLGFVFGIPRSLQEGRFIASLPGYGGNTNL